MSKNCRGAFGDRENFSNKVSQCQKTEKGTLWDFSTSILSQKIKKLNGGIFGEKFFEEKSLTVPKKTERKDPLLSSGFVCYATKGTTIIVQFRRPNGTIWPLKIS